MRKRFLTVNELAARWRVLPKIITFMIERGQIKAHKIGRVTRISLDTVDAFEKRAVLKDIGCEQ